MAAQPLSPSAIGSWHCPICGLTNKYRILCQGCYTGAPYEYRQLIISKCKETLSKHNQAQVFDHINTIQSLRLLNDLILQIKSIDFPLINKLYERGMREEKEIESKGAKLSPFPHSDAYNISTIGDVPKLIASGFRAIAAGKCCVIILAGGQGTRLGFERPKGCYPIGAKSGKSIYQLLIEKALAIKRLAAQHQGIDDLAQIRFPLYFMTSSATHGETQSFLNQNQYFRYDFQDIHLFQQDLFPCLTEQDGKFIMETASSIAMSPNGNGGIYSSLKSSGIYRSMIENHIEYIQVFGIDNILARIGDPLWYGHMIESKADCSNKTCIKRDPHEKIGIMCLRNGKPAVTEYTELTKDMVEMKQKANANELEYCYGNLAMHQFHIDFISKICNDIKEEYPLPIHIARKKIPFCHAKTMKTVQPEQPNGIKLEFFVFDTFQYSNKCTVYNILREEEFAPVKNAKGNDSPRTARVAVSNYWKKQIMKHGGAFSNDKDGNIDDLICEVSPLFAYLPYADPLFKKRVNGKTFTLPVYLEYDPQTL